MKPGNQNAAKHGLCARVGDLLHSDATSEQLAALTLEFEPSSATEAHLVREMARHAAALQRAEALELAVLKRGAAIGFEQPELTGLSMEDRMLAAAGTSDSVDRVSRYRKSHERAFLRSLSTLRQLREGQLTSATDKPVRFDSEEACTNWLRDRAAGQPCPKCSSKQGHWLGTRNVWQCSNCRHHRSLRTGTVFERSPLPLLTWFRAIQLLTDDPNAASARLSKVTSVARRATLRRMRKRIISARSSDAADELLAGLAPKSG